MDLQTISQVSRAFQISTRTLRYYEQIGLLKSVQKEEYAYRTYDESSVVRLQQIIILRKLRIPLKEIKRILDNKDVKNALEIFRDNLKLVEEEMEALSTIQSILNTFIHQLNENSTRKRNIGLFETSSMMKLIDSLTVTKIHFKEEKSMEDLNKAKISLSKLTDVRIIYLPPATVASSHYVGKDPEDNSGYLLDQFVRDSKLYKKKPDLRLYGFNHPNPSEGNSEYGYERWVTIPDEMEVPEGLIKKHFLGGMYAAHMIPMGAFEEWGWLYDWVEKSDKYEYNPGDQDCMNGCLEEHLNYINYVQLKPEETYELQLDLLMPIKNKN
jgi:DNA-binding transcriptional MerR regulator/DNA gyrase inhibitor GyrI